MMDAATWLAAFAQRLEVEPPSAQETDQLLALAGVAAHASERVAAPIACWLTARAALAPDAALAVARELGDG